jgi:septal ring factor EnvC (AmiA/AmiB activator)
MADVFRELAARLESRAAEAAELRTRLELTERTQSTLEDERQQALEELSEERRRREEAERERDELRRRLGLGEARESPETPVEKPEGEEVWVDAASSQEGTERPQERRGFWSRLFGG